ncbi:hypothetical protein T492DRAFT_907659, partial [Pavlovales sp. CCMP2436]
MPCASISSAHATSANIALTHGTRRAGSEGTRRAVSEGTRRAGSEETRRADPSARTVAPKPAQPT